MLTLGENASNISVLADAFITSTGHLLHQGYDLFLRVTLSKLVNLPLTSYKHRLTPLTPSTSVAASVARCLAAAVGRGETTPWLLW